MLLIYLKLLYNALHIFLLIKDMWVGVEGGGMCGMMCRMCRMRAGCSLQKTKESRLIDGTYKRCAG